MSAVKDLWLRAQEPNVQLSMAEIAVLRRAKKVNVLEDINLQCNSKEFHRIMGAKKCTKN